MQVRDAEQLTYIETAKALSGSDRRLFMARVVQNLGRGGQRWAEAHLSWGRQTIRKGLHELASGIRCQDAFSARGRKAAEVHLPQLRPDIQALVDDYSQTDPSFQTTRRYTRLSAAQVRQHLIEEKGYTDAELPTAETIRVKLNAWGYALRPVQKSRPQKKFPKPMLSSTN
jgi:hypothetical protein